MPLLRLQNVSFSYLNTPLLEDLTFQIEEGERIGLLGRNGAGKSTLLKLIEGALAPDHGDVKRQSGLRIARLAQEVPQGDSDTILEVIGRGLGEAGSLAARIHLLESRPEPTTADKAELDRLHHAVDTEQSWKLQHQIEQTAARMSLDLLASFASLSSGMKRRVLLAQALVSDPQLLLLDEPTNHLDLESIRWLEEFLLKENLTLLFITHDRAFLQRLANRVVEVDRGQLFDWTCDYATFLERKELALAAQAKQDALFDRRLAEEEVWIRQGIKARRTRNEGRVRRLEAMRLERQQRRERVGNVRMQVQEAERSGALVAALNRVSHRYGDLEVLKDVTTTIFRGDKVGILGPNGAGKTTLLRILLGELEPVGSGVDSLVRRGTNLEIRYFDQLRAQLDDEQTPASVVGEGNDTILLNDKPRHVLGYLSDFLFSGERARTQIKYLSGGERNRLLLAKMFARPANLLVLDEPTNDLDAETLELLEELLVEYAGTLLVVSHDRVFLDNVVTSTLVFEGEGRVGEYVGGYTDWVRQRSEPAPSATTGGSRPAKTSASPAANQVPPAAAAARKLSYKEQKELAELPQRIEQLETEQAELHRQMGEPSYYQQPPALIAQVDQRLKTIHSELEQAYARWSELEP